MALGSSGTEWEPCEAAVGSVPLGSSGPTVQVSPLPSWAVGSA